MKEGNQLEATISYIARKYGISRSLLFDWRNRMVKGVKQAVAVDDVVSSAKVKQLKHRIRKLERVLGQKTLENQILKDAMDLVHPKK